MSTLKISEQKFKDIIGFEPSRIVDNLNNSIIKYYYCIHFAKICPEESQKILTTLRDALLSSKCSHYANRLLHDHPDLSNSHFEQWYQNIQNELFAQNEAFVKFVNSFNSSMAKLVLRQSVEALASNCISAGEIHEAEQHFLCAKAFHSVVENCVFIGQGLSFVNAMKTLDEAPIADYSQEIDEAKLASFQLKAELKNESKLYLGPALVKIRNGDFVGIWSELNHVVKAIFEPVFIKSPERQDSNPKRVLSPNFLGEAASYDQKPSFHVDGTRKMDTEEILIRDLTDLILIREFVILWLIFWILEGDRDLLNLLFGIDRGCEFNTSSSFSQIRSRYRLTAPMTYSPRGMYNYQEIDEDDYIDVEILSKFVEEFPVVSIILKAFFYSDAEMALDCLESEIYPELQLSLWAGEHANILFNAARDTCISYCDLYCNE